MEDSTEIDGYVLGKMDSIDKADELEDTSNKPGLMKTIVYSVCAIFAAMILIAFMVLMKTACNRNKNINQQQIRMSSENNEYYNTMKTNYYENVKDRKRVNMNESIPYENLNKE
ncbi:unnamed protein product [Euphydryas editha]|uniref:Uncharacterized protein n=1 Tax=Euphydryas editha TaxID=104508 RepID=A0AAU9UY69_EUPED|nr:unnamed protein product [Euphydryas editha]